MLTPTEYYISGLVSSLSWVPFGNPAIESYVCKRKHAEILVLLFRFCKIIARAFGKLKQFLKRVTFQKHNFPCRLEGRTSNFSVVSLSHSHLRHRGSTLTSQLFACLCVNIFLIFNPWWIFSPCNMFMCTRLNKTCFAGVGTRPKNQFWIKMSFLSYPCDSKKIRIFCQQIRLRFPV